MSISIGVVHSTARSIQTLRRWTNGSDRRGIITPKSLGPSAHVVLATDHFRTSSPQKKITDRRQNEAPVVSPHMDVRSLMSTIENDGVLQFKILDIVQAIRPVGAAKIECIIEAITYIGVPALQRVVMHARGQN